MRPAGTCARVPAMLRPLLLVVPVLALLGGTARAATYPVGTTADPAGACATPPTGCSLRQALAAVNAAPSAPDVIRLPAGTYANTQGVAFPVVESVSIVGAGSRTTIVSGSPGSSVFQLPGTTGVAQVAMSGITITGGNAPADGGGIDVTGTVALALVDVAVVGNRATVDGGGLNIRAGTGSPFSMTGGVIANNTATRSGGGVNFFNASPVGVLRNVTVTGNAVTAGVDGFSSGGLSVFTSTPQRVQIIGSTISGNRAAGDAAAPGNIGGRFGLRDTIVANGVAAGTFTNCNGSGGDNVSGGHNLEDRDQCFQTKATGDQVGVDPLLGPFAAVPDAASTLALLPGSPAINAGSPGACNDVGLLTDQRGLPRPQGRCDVGAFEFQLPAAASAAVAGTPAVGTAASCSPASVVSPDGPVSVGVVWLIDGAQVATGDTYTPVAADAGRGLACRVTPVNAAGSGPAVTSAAVAVSAATPAPSPPAPAPAPAPAPPGRVVPPVGAAPRLTLSSRTRSLRTVRASRGFLVAVKCDVACSVAAAAKLGRTTVATGKRAAPRAAFALLRLKLNAKGVAALRGRRTASFVVRFVATAANGRQVRRTLTVRAR